MYKLLIGLMFLITISACTTAGPYVTSISSDGNCNLVIEKGYSEYNWFTGTIGNKEGYQSKIKVCHKDYNLGYNEVILDQ